MKHIKLFEDFLNETVKHMVSGNSGRTITVLDHNKYELKKDIKGARIGDYTNVTLPKGTIIKNIPGGVFAKHEDLKAKYCTGYKSERWDDSFGVQVRSMPDTLEDIENNSKVLESFEQFVTEKKAIDYVAYVDDKRSPGGTDKEIMDDYSLQVLNRTKSGFDIKGTLEAIEAFIEDYGIILDEEPSVAE